MLNQAYEQRYKAALDIQAYGHTSAFDACMAFLWEVSRTISRSNPENPVLGVVDEIALTGDANCLASWPSLYLTLCKLAERKEEGMELTAVQSLLEHQWHSGVAGLSEGKMSFFNEEGVSEKVTSIKQLALLVIHWREQWKQWQQTESRRSRLEDALALDLELVPGNGDELVLRVLREGQAPDVKRLCYVPKTCKAQMWTESASKLVSSKVKSLSGACAPAGSAHCAAIPTGIVQRRMSQLQSAR